VLFAEKGLRAMLYGTLAASGGAASDVHPVVYYTALNGWMRVAGQSPLAVRALSVCAGIVTLALLFDLCRRLFGRRAALVALALAALSPFHVYYSQEARMYAPLALWATLAAWCVARLAREARSWARYAGVLAVASALALYMQSLAASFLLALGLGTLPRPRLFGRVAAAGVGAAALYLPWLLQLPGQFAKLRQAYWLSRPTPLAFLQTLLIFHSGEEFLEAARPMLLLPLAAGLLAAVLLLYTLWRARSKGPAGANAAAYLAALAAAPPLLMFLASLYQPVYLQRALLPSALMYYAALGWAAARAMPRPVAGFLLAAVALAEAGGLAAHYRFNQFPRPDFPALTAYLAMNARPGDVVVHSNKLTMLPAVYYDRALPQTFVGDPPGSGSDTLAYPTQQALGLYARTDIEAAAGGAGRVWFVIFDRAVEEYRALGQPTHPHLAWLEAHYKPVGLAHFGDLAVYEFGK
jgi:4-amino-4-deoxy-L-arabinose transferase-like glycosyltransferase